MNVFASSSRARSQTQAHLRPSAPQRFLVKKLFLIAVFACTLLLAVMPWMHSDLPAVAQSSVQAPPAISELRGVWLTNVDSDVLFSRRKLDQGMQRLANLHFNTAYPAVWNWGYSLYPSSVAERAIGRSVYPNRGLRGRNMLTEAVEAGHRHGLAVLPWFEFGLMAPAGSELVVRHPDWVTSRSDGTQVVMEGKWPRVWLNPAHPEVQQFIVDMITEMVVNYDIDGIQLDDHFGMPYELGYDPYTIQRYQQEHNGQRPPNNPADPEWMRWRANHVSQLMVRVFEAVKSHKPDCVVSLSPNSQEFSYRMYLQDWGRWEREGYVEEVIVQVYRDSINSFAAELDRPEISQVRNHIPTAVGILAGLKDRLVDPQLIERKVHTVREKGLSGVAFFFYETLNDRDDLLRSLFAQPAARPIAQSLRPT
ncbi:glycoside hydrolase family 10 protein [Leptolyngbya sp. AN02str]|uniref:glycoside hydrolase family 10 protein n=1 Tax=Leptolyngbya sp. AN02str TaxID=3423363 RepID=UPI003D3222F0